MRRKILGFVLAVAALAAMSVPLIGPHAASAHSHFVVLPDGSCAWLTGAGSENGANTAVEGAAHDTVHPLHNMVHVGTAGAQMDNPQNPVDVDKDVNAGVRCPGGFVND